ncbi:MbnP family copper-binding protein [Aliikangiella sp. G2MR2-5]|uniref:MbnP family copper-binding protein n=1 Tax=Aliikangiella sp. G2MR2-5 TaxID=2788943 RepID=UPI0018A98630|nr:MbnP family copper-binding protein [Aliikangiella sp. G2MR2-5]
MTILRYIILYLVCLTLFSCSEEKQPFVIKFSPTIDRAELNCNQSFSKNNRHWQLSQLQFYIYDLKIKGSSRWFRLTNAKDGNQNANADIFLIGEVCGQEANWQILVKNEDLPETEELDEIEFKVGVPFDRNHLNPITQPYPLNQPDMFWTWQMGYKFFRIELKSKQTIDSDEKNLIEDTNHFWMFHLGSTGCQSPSPVRAPGKECKHPNQVQVQLQNFNINQAITLDIGQLIDDINIVDYPGCQSSPDDPLCEQLLNNVGVNGKQQVFMQVSR